MIRDLLMRWAHAAELAELRRQIRELTQDRDQLRSERDNAIAFARTVQAQLDARQPIETADWKPEPGDLVTGESLPLGLQITGRFTRWHGPSQLFAVLDGHRRVYTHSLRPADQ